MAAEWDFGTMSQCHCLFGDECDDATVERYSKSGSGDESDCHIMNVDDEVPPALMSLNWRATPSMQSQTEARSGDFDSTMVTLMMTMSLWHPRHPN